MKFVTRRRCGPTSPVPGPARGDPRVDCGFSTGGRAVAYFLGPDGNRGERGGAPVNVNQIKSVDCRTILECRSYVLIGDALRPAACTESRTRVSTCNAP